MFFLLCCCSIYQNICTLCVWTCLAMKEQHALTRRIIQYKGRSRGSIRYFLSRKSFETQNKRNCTAQKILKIYFCSSFFSVCGNRSLEQETIPSGRYLHGGKRSGGLRSLLSLRNLQHDSHLSRRSVTARTCVCVFVWFLYWGGIISRNAGLDSHWETKSIQG